MTTLEPPNDARIFNRRQPNGTFRPLVEFFAVQSTAKALYISDYRIGWWMMVTGIPYSQCGSEGQRDGWIASGMYDTELKWMGVRG